jgi:hypothetical protein
MAKKVMAPKRILLGEKHIVLYSMQAYIDFHEKVASKTKNYLWTYSVDSGVEKRFLGV